MEQQIRAAIKRACTQLDLPEVDFTVEHPADTTHGDYASNVALVLAKQAGQPPHELAEQLVGTLRGTLDTVADITVAGPGFINFTLARDFFTATIEEIMAAGKAWGQHHSQAREVVLFEYTSPNLFKPLHIGNLVGNIIGESLSRLFEYNGADVRRCNYPSDIGLTVAKGVWGMQHIDADPDDINAIGEAYRAGNEAYESGEAKADIEAINRALYAGTDEALNQLRAAGIATSRRQLAALLQMLGTREFDTEIPESMVSEPGLTLVREHTGDVFVESDGAVVYPGEQDGLHTRVFINSQGLPTYEAKDVGHHKLKVATHPDWTQSIIVTGQEQREYFKVIFAALRRVFPEIESKHLEHIATGFLTLTTGKMSSRKGNVLTGESLLTEVIEATTERLTVPEGVSREEAAVAVAVAAIKYQILKQSVGSDIVFDKEAALSFEGDSGPYLQYTNARINSVLEKAAAAGVQPSSDTAPAEAYALERLLYRWPEVTAAALAERAPHHVTRYLTDLAGAFNTFYATEKIADASDAYAPYKAALAQAVGQTLQNGLWVLGIEAPERM